MRRTRSPLLVFSTTQVGSQAREISQVSWFSLDSRLDQEMLTLLVAVLTDLARYRKLKGLSFKTDEDPKARSFSFVAAS